MAAHYAGAIPLKLLKKEMERITNDLAAAEKLLSDTQTKAVELQQLINNALELAKHCAKLYASARGPERRMFNQGFFTKIYIDDDGSVSDAELQEPFVHVFAKDRQTTVKHREREQAGLSTSIRRHPAHSPRTLISARSR